MVYCVHVCWEHISAGFQLGHQHLGFDRCGPDQETELQGCVAGAAARRCSQQVTGQGDMAAACCVSAAARQPDQAVARRLERPLFALPENQQESLEHPQRPHPPTTAQRDELSGAGDCIWASEHDVITIDSSQLPSAEASKPHTADDDAIVIDDDTSSGRSSARSSSSDSADNAALSPPTPSPRVSS